jgi:hypothetical protein
MRQTFRNLYAAVAMMCGHLFSAIACRVSGRSITMPHDLCREVWAASRRFTEQPRDLAYQLAYVKQPRPSTHTRRIERWPHTDG